MKKKKEKGISRIDSGNTHGWFVRIYRNGTTHSEFYADKKNGGKGKALALALNARERLNKKLGPPSSRAFRIMKSNRANTSGVIGVSKTNRTTANGTVAQYYTVSWRPEPNFAKNKSFSIKMHGEKEAFDLAVAYRKKMEAQIKKSAKKQSR